MTSCNVPLAARLLKAAQCLFVAKAKEPLRHIQMLPIEGETICGNSKRIKTRSLRDHSLARFIGSEQALTDSIASQRTDDASIEALRWLELWVQM
jgi:hypothetical protein